MAARAASHMGAGLTTVAVPDVAFSIYAAALTCIRVHPLVLPGDFVHLLGLLAQGMEPLWAAAAAVWIHGKTVHLVTYPWGYNAISSFTSELATGTP